MVFTFKQTMRENHSLGKELIYVKKMKNDRKEIL